MRRRRCSTVKPRPTEYFHLVMEFCFRERILRFGVVVSGYRQIRSIRSLLHEFLLFVLYGNKQFLIGSILLGKFYKAQVCNVLISLVVK